MRIRLFGQRFTNALNGINEHIGRKVAWLLLCMTLIMFAVVVLRYLFNWGSIALQESTSYLHSLVFMLAISYTLQHDAHVRVDIFYQHLNPRQQDWVNLLGNLLLLLPVSGYIFYSSLDYVQLAWQLREASGETGGLPWAYLLKTLIPILAILLCLQAIADSIQRILRLLPQRS